MPLFRIYLLGFIVLIIGLAIAAFLLNVPPTWIGGALIALIVAGILRTTSRTKPKDPQDNNA